jgi:hypothetical protein
MVGVESGQKLAFVSGQFEQFSADRWFSSKACDEVGQEWVADCYAYNRLMNDLEPSERREFTTTLINQYNPSLADAVIHCYVSGLMDAEANNHLKPFGVQRRKFFDCSDVPKFKEVYTKQGNSWRHGFSRRIWTMNEMKDEWRCLCCICLVTGIHGSKLPINWDRIWDAEGLYQPNDVVSTLTRINDASRAHPAFHCKENFRQHLKMLRIPTETHPIVAAVKIIRPFVETYIETQVTRQSRL